MARWRKVYSFFIYEKGPPPRFLLCGAAVCRWLVACLGALSAMRQMLQGTALLENSFCCVCCPATPSMARPLSSWNTMTAFWVTVS
mgnify:CR=1 FL=1